jgi:hypothetical protein
MLKSYNPVSQFGLAATVPGRIKHMTKLSLTCGPLSQCYDIVIKFYKDEKMRRIVTYT